MSKERARRREERERESAIRTAARAAEAERRERREQRRRAVRNATVGRLGVPPKGGRRPGQVPGSGRPDSALARRRRARLWLLVGILVVVQVLAWVAWPGWAARLAVLVLSMLFAPLLWAFLVRRR